MLFRLHFQLIGLHIDQVLEIRDHANCLRLQVLPGLMDWLQKTMLASGCINRADLDLLQLVDNADEAAKIIIDRHRKYPDVIGGGF